MKLLENGLKAPNITPDKCQIKEQSRLIFSEFVLQLWWKCWIRTTLFSSEALIATPLTRKNLICLSRLSRATFVPKSKKFFRCHIHMDRQHQNSLQLWSLPWQQNNLLILCTYMHNPSTITQITAECLLSLSEVSFMQGFVVDLAHWYARMCAHTLTPLKSESRSESSRISSSGTFLFFSRCSSRLFWGRTNGRKAMREENESSCVYKFRTW